MPLEDSIRQMLSGGDRRSPGRADEVVELMKAQPRRVKQLVECLWNNNPCVCMRAADATEKLTRTQPELLQRYKASLLGLMAEAKQKEVRWHLAVTIPRLHLTPSECQRVAELLEGYLDDRSSIVKTCAMQGLSDLTRQDNSLRPPVMEMLRLLTRTGTPAMRARGRILLKRSSSLADR